MTLHSQFDQAELLPAQQTQWTFTASMYCDIAIASGRLARTTAAQSLPEQPWSSGLCWSKQATVGLGRNVLKVAYL